MDCCLKTWNYTHKGPSQTTEIFTMARRKCNEEDDTHGRNVRSREAAGPEDEAAEPSAAAGVVAVTSNDEASAAVVSSADVQQAADEAPPPLVAPPPPAPNLSAAAAALAVPSSDEASAAVVSSADVQQQAADAVPPPPSIAPNLSAAAATVVAVPSNNEATEAAVSSADVQQAAADGPPPPIAPPHPEPNLADAAVLAVPPPLPVAADGPPPPIPPPLVPVPDFDNPHGILQDEEVAGFAFKVSSPNNIADWVISISYDHTPRLFVQNFGALVFAAMRGPASFTAAATTAIRHVYTPNGSRMTNEDHLTFVQQPVDNLNLLARRAEVMIQVRFRPPDDGAAPPGCFVPWNNWISVKKDDASSIYVVTSRVFESNEVISVFCGERIWNSGVAYRNDAPAYEEGVPPVGQYGYVGRSPDATLGVFDAATCPLFMAVPFIDVTFDPNVANCAIDELGIVFATRQYSYGR